jgi:hypothetical protein
MKVRALETGYYGFMREKDEVFELIDKSFTDEKGAKQIYTAAEQFSDSWMENFAAKKSGPKNKFKDSLDEAELEDSKDI